MKIGAAVMWQDKQRRFHLGSVVRVCKASLVAKDGGQTKRLKRGQAHRIHDYNVVNRIVASRRNPNVVARGYPNPITQAIAR